MGGANDSIVARGALVFMAVLLLVPAPASALDPPEPLNVLFVANGYYVQETHIEDRFYDLGHDVIRRKDYQIWGSTNLAPYDLIVLTEFSPYVSTAGINNIENSGKPVLVVAYWDFNYARKLGLTTTANCGYVGTSTVEAVREGYDAFTSRVGVEALVYQPSYTVYGIDASKLTAGVTPLYWSSASFGEVAVLVDLEKKVAVTGVYDTRKYTADAWKLFDLLVEQITPPRPRWQTMQDVAQAYVDSGLHSFLEQVEQDLARDPGSWTFDEVEREAWLLSVQWTLLELWDNTQREIADLFDMELLLPIPIWTYDHPERPNVDKLPASSGGIPMGEDEHWFLGQYWYWDPGTETYKVSQTPYYWEAYHSGTDLGLGISTTINGQRIFYMGDTADPASGPKWSFADCEVVSGVRCDDMIVVSFDPYPGNGIDVSPVFEPFDNNGVWEARWVPLTIPGVHRDIAPELEEDYWYNIYGAPRYTVPSGAVSTFTLVSTSHPAGSILLSLPIVMVWYGTAIHPANALDDTDPRARPTSWTGCSFDGLNFRACYEDEQQRAIPFSIDVSPPGFGEPGEPARFIQVAAVPLTSADHDSICQGSPQSAMCHEAFSDGGVLLYGSGRPYRKSGLFLGFIRAADIGARNGEGRPLVYYWTGSTGSGWSSSEADAVSITHYPDATPRCDVFPNPGACTLTVPPYDAQQPAMFGEISARLIRSNDANEEPRIILMGNNEWNQWVYYWTAPLREPWGGDFGALTPHDTKTSFYGPYIIDAYSDHTYPGSGPNGEIELWHTISVWNGTPNTPYGVYSGKEVIPWP